MTRLLRYLCLITFFSQALLISHHGKQNIYLKVSNSCKDVHQHPTTTIHTHEYYLVQRAPQVLKYCVLIQAMQNNEEHVDILQIANLPKARLVITEESGKLVFKVTYH